MTSKKTEKLINFEKLSDKNLNYLRFRGESTAIRKSAAAEFYSRQRVFSPRFGVFGKSDDPGWHRKRRRKKTPRTARTESGAGDDIGF